MKFKLSQDSIFAVLLRSPLWMSAGLALVLCLGGFAVLPKDLAAMGVFVAVPFAAIALVSAVRRRNTPSQARILAVAAMSWAEFASTAEAGFQQDGCQVERLQHPGADFSLRKKDKEAVVSARRWKAASIGVEPLRQLQALRENAVPARRSS
ncbi:restriction endonuclease family protein [Bordetella holmesii 44057]|nr:restriction endonuclease family protein [Bordetella holmesii 44057]